MKSVLSKLLTVARWEYTEKIKSKAFLISLILIPVIMVAFGVLPTLFASRPDTEIRRIGVFDQSGVIFFQLSDYLDEHYKLPDGRPNYVLVHVADTVNSLSEGKNLSDAMVLAGEIEGYVIIPKGIMRDSAVEYRSENVGNIRVTERLTNAIRELIVQRKLHKHGIDPVFAKELASPLEMKTIKLSKTGAEESGFAEVFLRSYIFMMMLLFMIMMSGQMLVRSMLEEKSNRVVEVLMSSCSPMSLMGGKILGLSAVGLTQMGVWVVIGFAISLKFGIVIISLPMALLLLTYSIVGYLFYAGVFVAIGAPVSTEQEAQQITSYLTMILFIPMAISFVIMQNPNSSLVTIMTFIPLMTPTMMAMRIPINMPSVPEVVGSLLVLTLSACGAIWAAGKIFRTAILSYGKRPGIRELFRLLKAS